MGNELVKPDEMGLSPQVAEVVSVVVRDIMSPLMESIGQMLRQNTEAMEHIAAAQQITSERIAALEKRVRLQTPLSKSQENCINTAIRARARELLDAHDFADDKKAVTRLCGIIRKGVLARYGVSSLREAPAYDYDTAMKQITMWKDMLSIRDTVREARQRAEALMALAEQTPGVDGSTENEAADH